MNININISEEELSFSLWQNGLLDVLGLLALEVTDTETTRMVDDQYSGSAMHDQIPVLLRKIADEIERDDR